MVNIEIDLNTVLKFVRNINFLPLEIKKSCRTNKNHISTLQSNMVVTHPILKRSIGIFLPLYAIRYPMYAKSIFLLLVT